MVRTLNAATLLAAWDRAAALPAPDRAVALLATTSPERSAGEWADLPLGARDHALLGLREALFGTLLDSVASCPSCGEQIEARFRTADIEAPYAEGTAVEQQLGGARVRFRPPSQADLTAALATADPRRALLARCVESDRELDDEVAAAVIAAMAELDPQADVRVGLMCPACQQRQELSFDIGAYLWGDLNDWARNVLAEVHALASAYGWREEDILALSAFRRRMYMAMIGAAP